MILGAILAITALVRRERFWPLACVSLIGNAGPVLYCFFELSLSVK